MRYLIISLIAVFFLEACADSSKTDKSGKPTDEVRHDDKVESKAEEADLKIELTEATSAIENVELFVKDLGEKNLAAAFKRQKNKTWGDYKHFSSLKAFGGIWDTQIIDIEQKPDEKGKAVVYAEILYKDEINGDKTFTQNFYLQKFDGNWRITDMKLVKSKN